VDPSSQDASSLWFRITPARPHAASDAWMSLAVESLARAYGHSEPEYSAEDLIP
jgi:hypothetical protein